MSRSMSFRILLSLVFTFMFVSLAAAHTVTISANARIGSGPEVQAGTYKVEVARTQQQSAEVSFYLDGDLVAKVPATIARETEKCRVTEIHLDQVDGGNVITKIRLEGTTESLLFNPASNKAD